MTNLVGDLTNGLLGDGLGNLLGGLTGNSGVDGDTANDLGDVLGNLLGGENSGGLLGALLGGLNVASPATFVLEVDEPTIDQDALDIVANLMDAPEALDAGVVEPIVTAEGITIEVTPTSTAQAVVEPVVLVNQAPVFDSLLENQPNLI